MELFSHCFKTFISIKCFRMIDNTQQKRNLLI